MACLTKKQLWFLGVLVLCVFLIWYVGRRIIAPFVLAFLLAYAINPLVAFLESKGARRNWAILSVYMLILVLLGLLLELLVPRLLSEFSGILEIFPQILVKMQKFQTEFAHLLETWHLPFNSQVLVGELGQRTWLLLRAWLLQLSEALVKLFSESILYLLTPLLAYYFSLDYPKMKANAYQWIQSNFGRHWSKTFEEIDQVFRIYIRGQILDTTIVGILISIGLMMLGFDSAFLLGLLAGIFNLIPYFGSLLGALPAIVLALMQSPVRALYVGVLFLLVNQFEALFLAPRIIGGNLGIHPIIVLYLILIGGSSFGLIGMICAVPLGAIIIIIIRSLYNLCFLNHDFD